MLYFRGLVIMVIDGKLMLIRAVWQLRQIHTDEYALREKVKSSHDQKSCMKDRVAFHEVRQYRVNNTILLKKRFNLVQGNIV